MPQANCSLVGQVRRRSGAGRRVGQQVPVVVQRGVDVDGDAHGARGSRRSAMPRFAHGASPRRPLPRTPLRLRPPGRSAWLDIDWRAHQRWLRVDGRRGQRHRARARAPRRSSSSTGSAGAGRTGSRTCPRSRRDHRVIAMDLPGFGASRDARRARSRSRATRAGRARCSTQLGVDAGRPSSATRWAASSARSWRSAPRAASSACVRVAPRALDRARAQRAALSRCVRSAPAVEATARGALTRSDDAVAARARAAALMGVVAARRPLPAPLVAEQIARARAQREPHRRLPAALDALTDYPIRDRLPEIACPTLIVWGEDDTLVAGRATPTRDVARS